MQAVGASVACKSTQGGLGDPSASSHAVGLAPSAAAGSRPVQGQDVEECGGWGGLSNRDESRAVACGQVQSSVLSSQGQARKSVTFVYADVGPGAELSLLGKGQQLWGPDSERSFPTLQAVSLLSSPGWPVLA